MSDRNDVNIPGVILVATWKARSLRFTHEKSSMSCRIRDYGGAACCASQVVEQPEQQAGRSGLAAGKLP
jgi:hypothetical protein